MSSSPSSMYTQLRAKLAGSYDGPVNGWTPQGLPYLGNSPHMRRPEEIENLATRSTARVRVFKTWVPQDLEDMQFVITACHDEIFQLISQREIASPTNEGWLVLLIWVQYYLDDSTRS